jgi:hypothetical protein
MSDRACVTRKLAMDVGEKLVLVDKRAERFVYYAATRSRAQQTGPAVPG